MERIVAIEIENLGGTKKVKFQPKTLTVIQGANGTGKTSIVDGIRYVFAGGKDPTMLRKGTEKGFIKLTGDDGTTILKTITPTKCDLVIQDKEGKVIAAPQTYINRLAESIAVDPAMILATPVKELAALLLKIMPIEYTRPELLAAIGDAHQVKYMPDTDGAILLPVVERTFKNIYEDRRVCNVAARDAEGTVKDLSRNIPEEDGKDWEAIAKEEEAEFRRIEEEARLTIVDIDRKLEKQIEGLRTNAEADRQVIRAGARTRVNPVLANKATAEEKAKEQQRIVGMKQAVERAREKAVAKFREYETLDSILLRLTDLKKSKLEALPIPGLSFDGEMVLVDGVEWPHVNLATRIDICFQLSEIKSGDLGLMILDDTEHLDGETWNALCEYVISRKDRQVIAAQVADGALNITTYDTSAEVVQEA